MSPASSTARPVLLLHGGAGPQSMQPLAGLLTTLLPARVVVPTHPGFHGTPRQDGIADVPSLAAHYISYLDSQDLSDVVVVGNSFGGWLASELALLNSPRVSALVILNGGGIRPLDSLGKLSPAELSRLAHHDPSKFSMANLSDEQKAAVAASQQAIVVYGGPTMSDPTLEERLKAINVPTLVVWGESDQLMDTEYGRALARAIPGAEYRQLSEAGHLPQLEKTQATAETIIEFLRK